MQQLQNIEEIITNNDGAEVKDEEKEYVEKATTSNVCEHEKRWS